MAEREGLARTASSASASVRAADTRPSMPRMLHARTVKLGLVGTLAGFFSGLFGIGGGIVIVPLLILWLGRQEREATGTSLAAIALIASVAAAVQGLYGNVRLADALLLGVLSVGGGALGVALANALPERALRLGFAALLVVVAAQLLRRGLAR